MSRVQVKHLPGGKFPVEKALRDAFEPFGPLTDLRVIKRNGKSRKFAFIGFADEGSAAKAIAALNNTYIGASRITVEPAVLPSEAPVARPWSRFTVGTSAWEKSHPDEAERIRRERKKDAEEDPYERHRRERQEQFEEGIRQRREARQDARFQAFLEAVTPRSVQAAWRDADVGAVDAAPEADVIIDTSDDSDVFDAAPVARKLSGRDIEEDANAEDEGTASSGSSDADGPASETEPQASGTEPVAEQRSSRVFVRNLAFDVGDEQLQLWADEELVRRGVTADIQEAHVVKDRATGRGSGIAFLSFASPDEADRARAALDGRMLAGRLVHCMRSAVGRDEGDYRSPADVISDLMAEGATYKAAKKASDRRFALRNTRAWSATALVSSDAVASRLAQELFGSDSKVAVVGKDQGDAGVALALGAVAQAEQVATWLRAGFGVDIAAAAALPREERASTPRDKRRLLAKQLPPDVTEEGLRTLFARFGTLRACALAPTGGTGFVEFDDAGAAKLAFRALEAAPIGAQKTRLRLEFIPLVCTPEHARAQEEAPAVPETVERVPLHLSGWRAGDVDDAALAGFVRFYISQERRDHEGAVVPALPPSALIDVSVAQQRQPDGTAVPQPFGFANFNSLDAARTARRLLRGRTLAGAVVAAALAGLYRGRDEDDEGARAVERVGQTQDEYETRAAGKRLIIRNVPFNATPEELRSLLSGLAHLTSLRCPRKDDGLRGFVFAEFASHAEAQTALDRIRLVSLRGRHLVPEWEASSGHAAGQARARADMGRRTIEAARRRALHERVESEDDLLNSDSD